MDINFWSMLFKIIIFLPFILLIIYASLKYGGGKLQSIQNGKFIRVIEKVSTSKESSILVVKIGEKGYVMSSNNHDTKILFELDKAELIEIETKQTIPQYQNLKELFDKLKIKRGR